MYNFYSRKCPNSPKCSNCILFVNSNANFVNTDILSLRCVCNWHLCKNAKKWSKFASKCYFQPSLSLKKMSFYHFKVFYTLSLRYMTIGINGVFIRNQNIFVVILLFFHFINTSWKEVIVGNGLLVWNDWPAKVCWIWIFLDLYQSGWKIYSILQIIDASPKNLQFQLFLKLCFQFSLSHLALFLEFWTIVRITERVSSTPQYMQMLLNF